MVQRHNLWYLIPNILTIARLCLVLPIVQLLRNEHYPLAFGLAFIAMLSDALDGYLARRFNWRTELGAFLDPVADKTMMISLFVTLGWIGHLPLWIVAVVVGRDLFILSGVTLYRIWQGALQVQPTFSGKLSTLLQMSLMSWALLILAFDWVGTGWPIILDALMVLVVIAAVVSAADYFWVGMMKSSKRRE